MPSKARPDDGLGFDNVPEVYDRIRPTYPSELFDELFAYLGPSGAARALEIGAGTGQATRPLLERGMAVTAVEPGERMAAFLSEKLSGKFPALRVIAERFDVADLVVGTYDLVLAATSFHWLDPESRFGRCHRLLREHGVLAVINTNQIDSDADRGFFAHVQPVYDRHQSGGARPALPDESAVVPPEYDDLVASRLFDDIQVHRHRQDRTYTSTEYADLMRSYSDAQAMTPAASDAMIRDVCGFIDTEFEGKVTRPLVFTLTLGRRQRTA